VPGHDLAFKSSKYQELKAKEDVMVWIAAIAIAMAGVGGFWVKVRRERKAKGSNT
jgi:hypothetical protein